MSYYYESFWPSLQLNLIIKEMFSWNVFSSAMCFYELIDDNKYFKVPIHNLYLNRNLHTNNGYITGAAITAPYRFQEIQKYLHDFLHVLRGLRINWPWFHLNNAEHIKNISQFGNRKTLQNHSYNFHNEN